MEIDTIHAMRLQPVLALPAAGGEDGGVATSRDINMVSSSRCLGYPLIL